MAKAKTKSTKPKNYSIRVTDRLIGGAKREHSGRCMVADAIRQHIAGAHSVDVSADTIRFCVDDEQGKTHKLCYPVPARVGLEIARFDDDGPAKIKPFEFRLNAAAATTAVFEPRGPRKEPKRKRPKIKARKMCRKTISRRRHGLKVIEEV